MPLTPTPDVTLTDRILWMVIGLFMIGTLARTLISKDPFDVKHFAGEMLLSAIGGVALYFGGLLRGMTPVELIFMGALAGMGGVRMIEWTFKIVRHVSTRVR